MSGDLSPHSAVIVTTMSFDIIIIVGFVVVTPFDHIGMVSVPRGLLLVQ
jgi:hypothetical protein